MSVRVSSVLAILVSLLLQSCASNPSTASELLGKDQGKVQNAIAAQRKAGHPSYNPQWLYVVDPSKQRMYVVSLKTGKIHETLRCGTGKRGLGFGHAQTPTGFYTMGGVRIAKNGSYKIQTGDTKKGVAGIYAEILYPPTHPDSKKRGYVHNGVVIHSYNPDASDLLGNRRSQRLIGRVPCTFGCPVPEINEAPKLVPYLKQSAGKFDPTAKPNANLRSLISRGQVKQYQRNQLGDPIYILNRR